MNDKILWVVQHESKPLEISHPIYNYQNYRIEPGHTERVGGILVKNTCALPAELPSNTSYVLLLERGSPWAKVIMKDLVSKTMQLNSAERSQHEEQERAAVEKEEERIRRSHEVLAEELTEIGMHCTRLLEDYFLHGSDPAVLVQEIKNLRSKLYVQAATERLKKGEL